MVPNNKDENHLQNYKVLFFYLFQKQEKQQSVWKKVYPIIFANIIKCYKTGDQDYDIADFDCSVNDYCSINSLDRVNNTILESQLLKLTTSETKRYFAASHQPLVKGEVSSVNSQDEDESAFFAIKQSNIYQKFLEYFYLEPVRQLRNKALKILKTQNMRDLRDYIPG